MSEIIDFFNFQTTGSYFQFSSVTYGNGLFVAVGRPTNGSGGYETGKHIMTSSDGLNWSVMSAPRTYDWSRVAYGNGMFVALARGGFAWNATSFFPIMTSPDGITWTSNTNQSYNTWSSITYGNGRFVAVASYNHKSDLNNLFWTSTNGTTWSGINTRNFGSGWSSVTYGTPNGVGLFVAVGTGDGNPGNRVMTSSNGTSWTKITTAPDNDWTSVTYGNGLFVAVGYGNSITGYGSSNNRIMTSTDGQTWTLRSYPTGFSGKIVIYGQYNGTGLFVADGQSKLVTSRDGITWTNTPINQTFNSIAYGKGEYGDGLFVCLPDNYVNGSTTPSVTTLGTKLYTTITNFSLPNKNCLENPFEILNPTTNSDGLFSYSSSNTDVATIDGNTVTIVGGGTTTITAIQSQTNTYRYGTATTTFIVNKLNATIYDFNLFDKIYGEIPFDITNPTSTGNGPFSYTSSNTGVATISGNTITIKGAGTTTITAIQTETSIYKLATKTTTFTVNKASATLGSFTIPSKKYNDVPFLITNPTSNSGGSWTYISENTSVATISGNTITIEGAGTATITAIQTATTNYNETAPMSTIFTVSKATPILGSFTIPTKEYGDNFFLITDPTSNSDGSWTYVSDNTSVATIDGKYLTVKELGTAIITATQAGTSNYVSTTATTSISVNKVTTILTDFIIPNKTYRDIPFLITDPSSNSSGSFKYESSEKSVATIIGNVITVKEPGTTTITVIQNETAYYKSASLTTTFVVEKITTTINSFSIPKKTLFGDSQFFITNPSLNRIGQIKYESLTPNVVTVTGNRVTTNIGGTAQIKATVDETTYYKSATATAIFTVEKLDTYFDFGPWWAIPTPYTISDKTYGDDPFTLTNPKTNRSGTFRYDTLTPNVVSVSENTVTIVGAGTGRIIITQLETDIYKAGILNVEFTVKQKLAPIIFPVTNINIKCGETFTLPNASSDNPNPFKYTIYSNNLLTPVSSENKITALRAGSFSIYIYQEKTQNYRGNSALMSRGYIRLADPIIGQFTLPTMSISDKTVELNNPSSDSQGRFSYHIFNPSIATVSGNTVTIHGAGQTFIQVYQLYTDFYNSKEIIVPFVVNKATPSLTDFTIPNKIYGSRTFEINRPNSNSNGSFTYTSLSDTIARVSEGGFLTLYGGGTATIKAIQQETSDYTSAEITTTFLVNRATPELYWPSDLLPYKSKRVGDSPVVISQPITNSDGLFTYTSSNHSVATINGNILTIKGAGTTIIEATIAETLDFTSSKIEARLVIDLGVTRLGEFILPIKNVGNLPFQITPPVSNSDGPFTYTSSNHSVATINGNTLTVVGPGVSIITTIQQENSKYQIAKTYGGFVVLK